MKEINKNSSCVGKLAALIHKFILSCFASLPIASIAFASDSKLVELEGIKIAEKFKKEFPLVIKEDKERALLLKVSVDGVSLQMAKPKLSKEKLKYIRALKDKIFNIFAISTNKDDTDTKPESSIQAGQTSIIVNSSSVEESTVVLTSQNLHSPKVWRAKDMLLEPLTGTAKWEDVIIRFDKKNPNLTNEEKEDKIIHIIDVLNKKGFLDMDEKKVISKVISDGA